MFVQSNRGRHVLAFFVCLFVLFHVWLNRCIGLILIMAPQQQIAAAMKIAYLQPQLTIKNLFWHIWTGSFVTHSGVKVKIQRGLCPNHHWLRL